MDVWAIVQATLLGVVEGLTEFIPVSSTGHQIILGGVLALMILFAPDGLLPLLRNALRRLREDGHA